MKASKNVRVVTSFDISLTYSDLFGPLLGQTQMGLQSYLTRV